MFTSPSSVDLLVPRSVALVSVLWPSSESASRASTVSMEGDNSISVQCMNMTRETKQNCHNRMQFTHMTDSNQTRIVANSQAIFAILAMTAMLKMMRSQPCQLPGSTTH